MKRRILITGGSKGIGAAIAEAAAKRGWTNLLVSRDESKMKELIGSWQSRDKSQSHQCLGMDITIPDATERLTKWLDKTGYPDVVVHNAAVGFFGPFAETDIGKHRQTISIGIQATVELTHALLPRLIKTEGSQIVYLGSTSGRKPVPYMNVYSSTKSFIHNFAFALREELQGGSPKVLLVVPGGVKTDFPRLAGLPEEVSAKGLDPLQAGEMIVQAIEQGRDGMLTIGSLKEKYGGWLQRLLPPAFWAKKMGKYYRSMLD